MFSPKKPVNFYEHTWQLLLKVDENSSQKLTCLCKENLPLTSISAEHLEEGHQAYPRRLNPNIVVSGVTSSGRQKAVWASPALDVFLKVFFPQHWLTLARPSGVYPQAAAAAAALQSIWQKNKNTAACSAVGSGTQSTSPQHALV